MRAYTIFDTKTQAFTPPYFFLNQDVLFRALRHTLRDKDNHLTMSPNDYIVYECGTFDTELGVLSAHLHPTYIIKIADIPQEGSAA